MSLLADEERIPPVWERLPRIFAYPLQANSLVSLGFYTVLLILGMFIPVIGLIFTVLAYIGLYKFASDCLEMTAQGWMEPPSVQSSNTSWMLAKHMLLAVVLTLAILGVAILTGSGLLTVLTGVAVLLGGPAAVMIVVMTNSLLSALNPVAWLNLVGRIGGGYFIAVGLLFLLGLSQGIAEGLFAGMFGPGVIGTAGVFFISGYFLVASFHLMGYLLYANHEALGLEVTGAGHADEPEAQQPEELVAAERMIREGDTEGAIEHLGRSLRQGGVPEVHDRYRKLLALRDRQQELLDHAREYIPVLLYGHEQSKKAMQITEECLAMDAGFRPKEPKTVLDLARVMERFERWESVLRLTSGFARQHPKHPDVVENYFLGARALVHGRGEPEKAARVVRQLLERYPEHELRERMEQFIRRLEAGSPGKSTSSGGPVPT